MNVVARTRMADFGSRAAVDNRARIPRPCRSQTAAAKLLVNEVAELSFAHTRMDLLAEQLHDLFGDGDRLANERHFRRRLAATQPRQQRGGTPQSTDIGREPEQ